MPVSDSRTFSRGFLSALLCAGAVCLLATGCRGIATKSEKRERAALGEVTGAYRPEGKRPALPLLTADSSLPDLLRYAMLNNPHVAAAYYDYAAAVERITTERSLPDPRLTFEMDIQDVVMSVMPGLMVELPWFKKLGVRAEEASAESRAKYFAFEAAVLQAAYDVKRPFYQLHFLAERIRVNRETLRLLEELEQNARAQAETGRATLQDVLRAQIEQERLRTEIANLEDSRGPILAQLKAALGLGPSEPDPPVPSQFESTPLEFASEELFAIARERNPRLRQMQAEVRMAETGIRLAHLSRLPDFSAGIEADVKASPFMWRPSVGMTLPIWRDKIAAEIAAAQARKKAAEARLTAEEIQLAVDFADRSFTYRESTRNTALLTERLLPRAKQSLEIARASYSSGKTDFINLLDAERSLLEFRLAEVDARTQRELALAELSLLIAGMQPPGAPVLGAGVNLY